MKKSRKQRMKTSTTDKPASVGEFPEPIREALALHGIFRRMGYSSDDIFFHADPVTRIVAMQLQHEGKTFTVSTGSLMLYSRDEIIEMWQKAGECWNKTSEEEALRIVGNSKARMNLVMMVAAMIERGFEVPEGYRNGRLN